MLGDLIADSFDSGNYAEFLLCVKPLGDQQQPLALF